MNPTLIPQTDYPAPLRPLPLRELWVTGPLSSPGPAVAIIGSRKPLATAEAFACDLAAGLARAGVTVISGGAQGIDAAAHRGALSASGRTVCVAATGHRHTYPDEHAALYDEIALRGGTMVWPFPPNQRAHPFTFFARNRVLAALADALVIVQARARSGALNAAAWARKDAPGMRPVFVVLSPPWVEGFEGCWAELGRGARPLAGVADVLRAVGLDTRAMRDDVAVRQGVALPSLTLPLVDPRAHRLLRPEEAIVHAALGEEPRHIDEIVVRAGTTAQLAATALLTLALENVVVEGPAGLLPSTQTRVTIEVPRTEEAVEV